MVLVVAPLVALMVDQVQSLRAKGVNAAIVSSGGKEGKVAGDLLAPQDTLDSARLFLLPRGARHGQVEGCNRGT